MALVVADINKKKIKNVVGKTCIETRMISLLKGEIRRDFVNKEIELVVVYVSNLWRHLQ